MDSLRIDAGVIRITVNDDPNRVISFNPEDVLFAEKFYNLLQEFQEKQKEYEIRLNEIKAAEVLDETGIPKNLSDTLTVVEEICDFMRNKIDEVFGAGTSNVAFGEAKSLTMIEQFFQGIVPFIQAGRAQKLSKYERKKSS